jgi:hypothetical protein
MSKNYVDANYRFIAAANELNVRITLRQQALSLYVTLVLGLLAALAALRPDSASTARVPAAWLMLGFPVASLCLVMLNYKTERALTNLRNFLAALEQLDQAHAYLPSFNTDMRWSSDANRARRYHDYTAAVMVVAANSVAIGALLHFYPNRHDTDAAILVITIVTALGCVAALLGLSRWSYRPGPYSDLTDRRDA